MTKTLYLIRHGQTEGNKEGLWLGAKSPHKLNSTGIDQAKQVAKILISMNLDIDKIYSGPTPRAVQTADIISKRFSKPIEIIQNLTEIDLGILEDKNRPQGLALFPEEVKDFQINLREFTPPLGESISQAMKRLKNIIFMIYKNSEAKDIICISHGVIIKLLLADIFKADLSKGELRIDVPHLTHGDTAVIKITNNLLSYKTIIRNAFPDSRKVAEFG